MAWFELLSCRRRSFELFEVVAVTQSESMCVCVYGDSFGILPSAQAGLGNAADGQIAKLWLNAILLGAL